MNQQRFLALLAERAVYGLVLFCILIGSLVASVNSETLKKMPAVQRYVTQFAGFLVVTLITGYLVDEYKWNTYALCGIGLFLGMGSVKFILWLVDIWQQSNSFEEFFSNLARIVNAFLKAYRDVKTPDKNNPNDDTPAA